MWTDYPKGQHLFSLQPRIGRCTYKWKSPRRAASLLCRLRHGHCALNDFLSKIGVAHATCPSCGLDDETVEHYLLHCPKYEHQRRLLLNSIAFNLPTDEAEAMKILLATHTDIPLELKHKTLTHTIQFISATKRFDGSMNTDDNIDTSTSCTELHE